MPIRLRLAAVFMVAWAIVFAAGGWLLVSQLCPLAAGLDRRPALRPARPGRPLPARVRCGARPRRRSPCRASTSSRCSTRRVRSAAAAPTPGTAPLLDRAELGRARHGRIAVTTDARRRTRAGDGRTADRPSGWVAVAGVSLEALRRHLSELVPRAADLGAGLRGRGRARRLLAGPARRCHRSSGCAGRWPRCPSRTRRAGVQVPRTRDEIAALATTMNDAAGAAGPGAVPAAGAGRGRQP